MIDGPASCIGCRAFVDRFQDEAHLNCYGGWLRDQAEGVKYVTIKGWPGGGRPPLIPELAGMPGSPERKLASAEGKQQRILVKESRDRWGMDAYEEMKKAMDAGRTIDKYPAKHHPRSGPRK